ncbi:MAG: hypothetical protein KL787_01925 [Taibaiella sp.]|nr:hypothetical protein [Taibaiella sp.]
MAQDYDAFLKRKKEHNEAWNENLKRIGLNMRTLPQAMEDAGAAALIFYVLGWRLGRSAYICCPNRKDPECQCKPGRL